MIHLSESSWSEEEVLAAKTCLENDTLTMGSGVLEFEKKFAEYVGSAYAVMVNSGSSANLLAAFVLKQLRPNDARGTVIVPSLSWSTTYFPWLQAGFKLKFVDVNLENFSIEIEELQNAISEDVVGICVPHILGADAGIARIMSIANQASIWVVEDTCESLGALSEGANDSFKQLGTFGAIGTYSFFRSHHISTMEGGMLVTDDLEIYHYALSMRAHGWLRELPSKNAVSDVHKTDWESKFKFYLPGFNLRPLEMSGVIGVEQLKKLPRFIELRRQNAFFLQQKLESVPGVKLQSQGVGGSWMAFALLLDPNLWERSRVIEMLSKLGVETRPVVAGDFLQQPVMDLIKESCEISGKHSNASYIHHNGLMFANHGRDLRYELEQLGDAFIKNSNN